MTGGCELATVETGLLEVVSVKPWSLDMDEPTPDTCGVSARMANCLLRLNGSPGFINLLDALNAWQLVRTQGGDGPACSGFV